MGAAEPVQALFLNTAMQGHRFSQEPEGEKEHMGKSLYCSFQEKEWVRQGKQG